MSTGSGWGRPRVVVVGAGLSGASCTGRLRGSGFDVLTIEAAAAPGGRMASPVLHGRPTDLGAAYFTVSDPAFQRAVAGWQSAGLVRTWTDAFDVQPPVRGSTRSVGPVRWAAPAGLASVVMAELGDAPVDCRRLIRRVRSTDAGLSVDDLAADCAVLAMPDAAARRLTTGDGALSDLVAALDVEMEPTIAVAAGWSRRTWRFQDGAFINDDAVLSFVADDGARRGDGAPVLVAHTTAAYAGAVDPFDEAQATKSVIGALQYRLGITEAPDWTHALLWEAAKPTDRHAAPFAWSDSGVGVANDAWSPSGSPRVESAWLSGWRLAGHIIERFGT